MQPAASTLTPYMLQMLILSTIFYLYELLYLITGRFLPSPAPALFVIIIQFDRIWGGLVKTMLE